jgi:phage shock protein A
MGIFTRFRSIFQARANSLADQMEDPKASLDYSLVRLEESHNQISRALVDVTAARKRLEYQQDKMAAASDKYEQQAREALSAGREDLAQLALQRRQEALARQVELDGNLDSLDRQLNNLKITQANLERKISLFKTKKEELKAIYDASRAQIQVREAVMGLSSDLANVGTTIQRAEERIREMQSRAEAIDSLIEEGVLGDALQPERDDIDRELKRISRVQAVENDLARLKGETTPPAQLASGDTPPDEQPPV